MLFRIHFKLLSYTIEIICLVFKHKCFSAVAFPSFENCDHVIVLISIDFPLNSKRDASFHHTVLIIQGVNGLIFMIILKMFREKISLIWMFLLFLLIF